MQIYQRVWNWSYVLAMLLGLLLNKQTIAAEDPIKNVTFDTIKFDLNKGDPFERKLLGEEIEKLVGKRIRIRGFILPSFQSTGITNFVLVRDNLECCFGPGAALFDCIIVEMSAGNTADFTNRAIAVEGTFDVREVKNPDGTHLAIYHLIADRVR